MTWTASGESIATSLGQELLVHSVGETRFVGLEARLSSPEEIHRLQSRRDSRHGFEWLAGIVEDNAGLYLWTKRRAKWTGPQAIVFARKGGGIAFDAFELTVPPTELAWSPDGRYLVATSGGSYRMLQLSNDVRELSSQQSDRFAFASPRFSADGRYLAMLLRSPSKTELLVFELSRNELVLTIRLPSVPTAVDWSSNLQRIATAHAASATEPHRILIWELPLTLTEAN